MVHIPQGSHEHRVCTDGAEEDNVQGEAWGTGFRVWGLGLVWGSKGLKKTMCKVSMGLDMLGASGLGLEYWV